MILKKEDLTSLQIEVEQIVVLAGQKIKASWNKKHEVTLKDLRDVVTNVDIKTENFLRKALKSILPEAGFIVEEGKTDRQSLYNWAIDPIDGTKYFSSNFPLFVTQVALLENDVPVLGVIYNPVSTQLFSASKGNGTKLDGVIVKPKLRSSPENSILDLDFGGFDDEIEVKNAIFAKLSRNFFRVRIFGGVVCSYMVTGALDAYIVLNKKNKIVDLAPNMIILQEAGIKTDFLAVSGYKPVLVASSFPLFEKIAAILNK